MCVCLYVHIVILFCFLSCFGWNSGCLACYVLSLLSLNLDLTTLHSLGLSPGIVLEDVFFSPAP
jgi:hypothetical protein